MSIATELLSFGGEYVMEITDNNAFDAHARERGWAYDNGGRYRDERWDWYVGPDPRTVLLRQPPNRIALVRFDGLDPTELWSGRVSRSEEFDQMLNVLAVNGNAEQAAAPDRGGE